MHHPCVRPVISFNLFIHSTSLLHLGGSGCSTIGWNPDAVVADANNYGWCGVDVDDECSMSSTQLSSQFNALAGSNFASMYSFTPETGTWTSSSTVNPDYFAMLSFWGSNWCYGATASPTGCAPIQGQTVWPDGLTQPSSLCTGYNECIPAYIQQTLQIGIGVTSSNLLLGLHAKGIDSAAITFWCQQIVTYKLAGVMISYINEMNTTLFQQLSTCLNPTPSNGCAPYLTKTGDNCWDIANTLCGDGNDWSTELFQDSSCTIPIGSVCTNLPVGQTIYSKCISITGKEPSATDGLF
jgi:hypothetical protein